MSYCNSDGEKRVSSKIILRQALILWWASPKLMGPLHDQVYRNGLVMPGTAVRICRRNYAVAREMLLRQGTLEVVCYRMHFVTVWVALGSQNASPTLRDACCNRPPCPPSLETGFVWRCCSGPMILLSEPSVEVALFESDFRDGQPHHIGFRAGSMDIQPYH